MCHARRVLARWAPGDRRGGACEATPRGGTVVPRDGMAGTAGLRAALAVTGGGRAGRLVGGEAEADDYDDKEGDWPR